MAEDPAAEKAVRRAPQPVAEAAPDSFAAAVELFVSRHVANRQNERTARETDRLLRVFVLPQWGLRPLHEIRKKDVHALMDSIIDRGAPVSANRVLALLKTAWRFWLSRDIAEWSPVQVLEKPTKEQARERTLSDTELVAIWDAAEGCGWPFRDIARLLILTAARRTEVAGARWTEMDSERGLWTIPSARRKGGISHSIPLSTMAQEIINQLPRFEGTDWCFPARPRAGGRGGQAFSGFSKAKARLDHLSGVDNWTLHDLRRTAATKMQSLGIKPEVIEAVLGHTRQGIQRVYQRHDFQPEMAVAFDAWARRVDELLNPERAQTNVVALR